MKRLVRGVVVLSATVACLALCSAAATPTLPALTCTLHPGRLGERQEVGCVLENASPTTTPSSPLPLLLVALPPEIGPDNAWLAGAVVTGQGGVVACGHGEEGPLSGSGVRGCPALREGRENATTPPPASLAACLPLAAGTAHPTTFYLTTPLPSACTDEALTRRAQPALLAVAGRGGSSKGSLRFSFALRARLPPPLPSSWVGGSVRVSFPPPVLVEEHGNGTVSVVATAARGGEWSIPAPGGRSAGLVGLVTAAAALASAGVMVGAVLRCAAGAKAKAA